MSRAAPSSYMHILPHYQHVNQAHLKSTTSVPKINSRFTLELPQDHQRRRSYTPAYPPAPECPLEPAREVAIAAGGAGGDDGDDSDENNNAGCQAAEEPAGLLQNESDVDDAANDGEEMTAADSTTADASVTTDTGESTNLGAPIDGNEHLQQRLQELADDSYQPVQVLEESWTRVWRVGDRTLSISTVNESDSGEVSEDSGYIADVDSSSSSSSSSSFSEFEMLERRRRSDAPSSPSLPSPEVAPGTPSSPTSTPCPRSDIDTPIPSHYHSPSSSSDSDSYSNSYADADYFSTIEDPGYIDTPIPCPPLYSHSPTSYHPKSALYLPSSSSSSSSYSSTYSYSYAAFRFTMRSGSPSSSSGCGNNSIEGVSTSGNDTGAGAVGGAVGDAADATTTDATGPVATAPLVEEDEVEDDNPERVAEMMQVRAEIDVAMEMIMDIGADGEMERVRTLSWIGV